MKQIIDANVIFLFQLLLNVNFFSLFLRCSFNVFNYSSIFMIHDISVTVVFAEAWIQRTKQCICMHSARSRGSSSLFVAFVLSASCHFIRWRCRLWRKRESRMKRDSPMGTIVSKRLRSRNETCAKLFPSASFIFQWHSVLKASSNYNK